MRVLISLVYIGYTFVSIWFLNHTFTNEVFSNSLVIITPGSIPIQMINTDCKKKGITTSIAWHMVRAAACHHWRIPGHGGVVKRVCPHPRGLRGMACQQYFIDLRPVSQISSVPSVQYHLSMDNSVLE